MNKSLAKHIYKMSGIFHHILNVIPVHVRIIDIILIKLLIYFEDLAYKLDPNLESAEWFTEY